MHPVCNITLHALLVAAWAVTGYCLVTLCLQPDAVMATMAAVQAANACVLLWFVWPRKVVRCG